MEIPSNPFAEYYVADTTEPAESQVKQHLEAAAVQTQYTHHTQDIEDAVMQWGLKGYRRVGSSEFVDRGNRMGVSHDARRQSAAVGASLVLFQFTPAKLRAIRRGIDGTIDMKAVRADPPAGLSPRGYYVTKAVFLLSPQPLSVGARDEA